MPASFNSPSPFHQSMPSQGPESQWVRGPHFTYLLPRGWTVGEEGNFALVLRSPDLRAGIIVFGQSGLLYAMTPEQYAHQAMMGAMRLAPDVQLFQAWPMQPMPGYTHAALLETTYTINGPMGYLPIRGIVMSHVAVGYGQCNGTITIAGAEMTQWESYRPWLPQVAMAALNTGPNPYGSTAMADEIHGMTRREGEAYAAYHAWSQVTWQAVTEARWASQDRQQAAMDPLVTGQQWTDDPYGNQPQRRSTTPAVIWVSRDGREIASPDPSYDPRTASDNDWRRVR
jgi:hypothetical protein